MMAVFLYFDRDLLQEMVARGSTNQIEVELEKVNDLLTNVKENTDHYNALSCKLRLMGKPPCP